MPFHCAEAGSVRAVQVAPVVEDAAAVDAALKPATAQKVLLPQATAAHLADVGRVSAVHETPWLVVSAAVVPAVMPPAIATTLEALSEAMSHQLAEDGIDRLVQVTQSDELSAVDEAEPPAAAMKLVPSQANADQ